MLDAKKFEIDKKIKKYTASDDEKKKVWFIETRYKEMSSARSVVDKDWDTYQQMIEAIFTPYPDERSSSTVPLASSIIELYVADAIKLETEWKFRGENSNYSTQAKALEYVWKYDFRKNNRRKAFIENEYITAGFWTSVIFTWYEEYIKKQQNFSKDETGKFKFEETAIKKHQIIVQNVDIRDFYIDDTATSIDNANDCILRQQISFEKFQNFKWSPVYKNIDKVSARSYTSKDHSFTTEEEDAKQGRYVELIHYWNVERDIYCVIANGVLVREHPMISTIDWEKALPFAIRVLGYKNYSIYGRGICEALLMFNSEVNNLREMLMDGIRRSNSEVIALWNWLEFNGREFSYQNEILTFDGQLAWNFQQIQGTPPNQAIFSYLTQIYKDIAIYVGIDIQNIIGQPQQTAFQTEVQREASQKRVNVWLTNRDLAFERFANLYKDLLQIFFPRQDAQGLYPQIEIEDETLVWKEGKRQFKKAKGKNMFEVTPDILQGELYVDVFTNVTAPTINAVDRQQKLDLLNSVGNIANGYTLAKQGWVDIESILPIKKMLWDIALDYNLEPQSGNSGDVQEALSKLTEEIKWLQAMKQPQQPQQQIQPNEVVWAM